MGRKTAMDVIDTEDADIVIFRKFPDGDVIALFPCLPAECLDHWPCQSYMRVGQHGAADPCIVHDTRPAKPRDYAALKAELERIGYRLAIRRRFPADAYARRKAATGHVRQPLLENGQDLD
jgi:hypothetical protein